MKILAFLFKYSWRLVTVAALAGLAGGFASVGLVAAITSTLSHGGFTSSRTVWYYVGLAAVLLIMRVVSSLLLSYLAQNATLELRMELSRQILASPLRRLEEVGAHRLLATLTGDVNAISGGILVIQTLILQGAMLVGCLLYLIWLSWTVFLGVFIFMIGAITIYQLSIKRAINYLRVARGHQDELFKHFRAMTEGTQELKLHRGRRDSFLADLLLKTAASLRRNNLLGNGIFILSGSWAQVLVFALIGLLLFALPAIQQVDSRVLIGFAFTISYVIAPIESIMTVLPGLGNANVSLQQIESLGLKLVSTVDRESEPRALDPLWTSLELDDVRHTYHHEQEDRLFVVGPLTLTFEPGSLIFLTGGNGSGKTTLVKLLTGLYAPESGEIRLDGKTITDENRDAYRQYFSAVFSNFYLFESLLGIESPNLDDRARDYLHKLQLEHKVQITAGEISTIDLSQGQRKRLALLTAYLEDRPIYVFDEWAADQDPLFKDIFYLHLLPELKSKGKTVFVISHDDRYYHLADRIIKLEDGQLEYDHNLAPAPQDSLEVLVN